MMILDSGLLFWATLYVIKAWTSKLTSCEIKVRRISLARLWALLTTSVTWVAADKSLLTMTPKSRMFGTIGSTLLLRVQLGTLKMQDWRMRDRSARTDGHLNKTSMESCLQKRVPMLSYRRANVLRVFHGLNYTALKRNFN